MSRQEPDERVRRSREAIVDSFNEIVVDRGFEEIRVAEIIEDAGVGRSTFYEHFRNKDELLLDSMSGMLEVLADAVSSDAPGPALIHVLSHFREHRQLARGLLNGPSAPQVVRALADLIELRLASILAASHSRLALPTPLAAMQAAESQMGLIRAWLEELTPCDPALLAEGYQRAARGVISALLISEPPRS